MLKSAHFGSRFLPVSKRAWLCLLLAISFLFNPFLTVPSSSFGTVVNHLPSFRATVASSELLKFAPQAKAASIDVTEAEVLNKFCSAPSRAPLFPVLADEQISVSNDFFSNSLWFRPPPTA